MTFKFKELEGLLVCPGSRTALVQEGDSLVCVDGACRLKFAIRDEIPIMLVDEADQAVARGMGRHHAAAIRTRPQDDGPLAKTVNRNTIPELQHSYAVARAAVLVLGTAIATVSTLGRTSDGRANSTGHRADRSPRGRLRKSEWPAERTPPLGWRNRSQARSRDGIGKFYFGREIAQVMGYQGIDWLERPERESEEHLSALIDSLKLAPGNVVADIGAGSGVISLMMAKKIGPNGTVLAVDIQEEMLSVLSKRLKQLNVTNVEPVHGTVKSPNLKAGSVDLALMVDVYHEFNFPYEMVREISKALKPGGRVVFVEYRKEDPNVPIKLVHKMTESCRSNREAGQPEFGLHWLRRRLSVLPRQHVIVFERRPGPVRGPEKATGGSVKRNRRHRSGGGER